MKRISILILSIVCLFVNAQDTLTNKDAIYLRPFLFENSFGNTKTAIGGYLEANTNYFVEDGISDGFSLEMRRFNIFLYSKIANKISFISELEFEHGTEEIELETALIDYSFSQAINFRGGVLLVPIGSFNQNHDSPKWDFIDRPLISTTVIPSTLSEVGFGLHGNINYKNILLSYEAYIVNGLDDGIINNEIGRTSIPDGKSKNRFKEDNNGCPSITGKLSFKKANLIECGLSFYGGVYNTFSIDGLNLDIKRRINLFALDANINIKKLSIRTEGAIAFINVPDGLGNGFGEKQNGLHIDLIYPILTTTFLHWEKTSLNTLFRYEFIDYNVGVFSELESPIYDHVHSVLCGFSLRVSPSNVLKLNYRYRWDRDIFGNPAVKTAGIQFGFASYF